MVMSTSKSNKYYTYLLLDSKDSSVFYVGKGCGSRMYKHEKDVLLNKIPNKTNYDLFYRIKNIIDSGDHIIYEKVKEDMEELESLALETACIDFYGIDNLCNYLMSWCGNSFRSEKTRKRQSYALKGDRSYMFGTPKTEEQKHKNRLAHTGSNNARYDDQLYKFINAKLNLVEECTQYDLRKKYNLDSSAVHYMISGKRKSVKGWSLGISKEEIEISRRLKISNKLKNQPKSKEHRENLWKNRKKKRTNIIIMTSN